MARPSIVVAALLLATAQLPSATAAAPSSSSSVPVATAFVVAPGDCRRRSASSPLSSAWTMLPADHRRDGGGGAPPLCLLPFQRSARGNYCGRRSELSASPPDADAEGGDGSDSDSNRDGDFDSDGDDDEAPEGGRAWLAGAMGKDADADADPASSDDESDADVAASSSSPASPTSTPLRDGLAGFAIDPARGFGAVLVSPSSSSPSDGDARRAVFAIISPRDRTTVMSPEALTLVQLTGGIDVAAAVFPPDALARAAFYDDDDDDDGDGDGNEKENDGAKVTLVGVQAVPSSPTTGGAGGGGDDNKCDDGGGGKTSKPFELPPTSPERESKLVADAPRFLVAARNLPGLAGVTEADVLAALRLHADAGGNLDRDAFATVLDALRRSLSGEGGDCGGVSFTATVAVAGTSGGLSTRTLKNLPPFMALALALRHKVAVTVSEELLLSGAASKDDSVAFDAGEVRERLPAFKPVDELEEDARAVDGFVPDMFFKQKPPRAE